jgi:hypothetical protein
LADDPARLSDLKPGALLDWSAVRVGLILTQAGWLLFLFFLLLYLPTARMVRHGETLVRFWLTLAETGLLITAFLGLTGMCLGCMAPPGSRARGWAVGFVLVLGVEVLLLTAYQVAEAENHFRPPAFNPPPLPWSAAAIRGLQYSLFGVGAVGKIAYLLFLASVACKFAKPGLLLAVRIYLLIVVLIAGASCCGVIVIECRSDLDDFHRARALFGALFFLILLGLALLVWMIVLVDRIRSALTEAVLRQFSAPEKQ